MDSFPFFALFYMGIKIISQMKERTCIEGASEHNAEESI
jgi:hypothetical protein